MTVDLDKYVRPGREHYLALGLEGSANKLGVGVIKHHTGPLSETNRAEVLSNVRDTYVTPREKDSFLEIPQDIIEIGWSALSRDP